MWYTKIAMPFVVDPNSLPTEQPMTGGRRVAPRTVIMWLLYPVIFAVGLVSGVVIGIKQAQNNPNLLNSGNVNTVTLNTSIVPNANSRVNTNTINANTNVSNAFNSNSAISGGDYLNIDAQTQAQLNEDEQKEKDTTVDQTVTVTDILRQQDLISLKYDLKAYYIVKTLYPNTNGVQTHLERGAEDIYYVALKAFFGGSYNQPVDPESPTYYYGYTSDGKTFTLTSYLVSKKKAFILTGP